MFIMVLKKNCYQTKKVTSNDLLDLRISSRGVYKFWEPFLPPPPIFQFVFSKVTACRARHMPKAEKIWSFRGVPRNSFPLGKKYDIEFCLFSVWAKNHLFPSLFLFPSFAFSFFSFFSFLSTQKLISPQGGGADRKINTPVYLKPSWLTFQMKGNDTSSWFVHIKNQSEVIWPL